MTVGRGDRPRRGAWRVTSAEIQLVPASAEAVEEGFQPVASAHIELWERPNRAFFAARLSGGSVIRELSAGPGYLRDHDHVARHQVIRESRSLARDLEIVRASFGPIDARAGDRSLEAVLDIARNDSGMPERLVLEDIQISWRYEVDESIRASEPFISRPRDFSWELYADRGLPFLGRLILGADLPQTVAGGTFQEGFLYASSWYRHIQAHLVWRTPAGEVELVVADTDNAAEPSSVSTLASATGQWRMADLRAPDKGTLTHALDDVDLDAIVQAGAPMPVVEGSVGRYRIASSALAG